MSEHQQLRLPVDQLEGLAKVLARRGYTLHGPTARDGAIVYDRIEGPQELPRGWTDTQEAGQYRLEAGPNGALFGYTSAAQSWKKLLHPPQVKLFEAHQENGVFRILNNRPDSTRPAAFLGVRACELAAIQIQDRALASGPFHDLIYESSRDSVFLVAVQCTRSGATCFCASMGTGPRVRGPAADLILTEMVDGQEHWFLAQAGTARGEEALGELACRAATEEERRAVEGAVAAGEAGQKRSLDTSGIQELFHRNFEHPRWDDVADRCLACANCTMVCPTCFCTTVEDITDVTGQHAERWRRWDSCFTTSFSYVHGGSVRTSGKARYRQWITHKLATWIDQFGSSGCVGCGRCITWCPVGIDITQEVQALRGAASHGNTNA